MPNYVKNVVKIQNIPDRFKNYIYARYCSMGSEDFSDKDVPVIDFDKIIPQPLTEKTCPPEFKVTKDSHITPLKDKPWLDWYMFNIKHWGTKWNAYDCYSFDSESKDSKTKLITWDITLVFNTAWTNPTPVIDELANKLINLNHNITIEHLYADEAIGSNLGYYIYTYDHDRISPKNVYKIDQEVDSKDEETMEEFAEKLWNEY